MQKVALIILDGYGIGRHDASDAIYTAKTPVMDSLLLESSVSRWGCSGGFCSVSTCM